MNLVANIIFIVVFLGMLFVNAKVLMDSNFEKLFKQGKVGSIRVGFLVIVVVFAFLFALALREFSLTLYSIFVN